MTLELPYHILGAAETWIVTPSFWLVIPAFVTALAAAMATLQVADPASFFSVVDNVFAVLYFVELMRLAMSKQGSRDTCQPDEP